MRQVIIYIVLFGVLPVASLHSQSPQLINYQGQLQQNGESASGDFSMTFIIYDAATGGTVLWDEDQRVTVTNGLFNVLLGSSDPLPSNLFSQSGERYLGIKVGSDTEMTPRFQFTSVAYALNAATVDEVVGGDNLGDHSAIQNLSLNGNWLSGDGQNEGINVNSVGNVGIGTSSPGEKLEVTGKIKTQQLQVTSGAATGLVLGSDASGNATWASNNDADSDPSNEIQDLSLSVNTLSLTNDVTNVDLTKFLDNTDNQTLSINGNNLSITGGNNVPLPNGGGFADSDQAYLDETDWFGNSAVDVISVTVNVSTEQNVLIMYSADCSSSPGQGAIELYVSGGLFNSTNRRVYCDINGESYPVANQYLDAPGSGTFTYTLRASNLAGGLSGKVRRVSLTAIVN